MITFDKFDKNRYSQDVIVTDGLIARLYGITGDNVYLLPRGEKAKSMYNFARLCKWLVDINLPKQSRVVAVGGGSVGDVAGFAASVYKRGVNVLNVPTTLLAMVDSAIGGKTAIDMCGVKNVIGSFVNCNTLTDTDFLNTLPPRQIRYAMGEILKYRMLDENIDSVKGDVKNFVRPCALFKEKIVSEDRYDKGMRKILNMGHTVGHALELQYGISHGEAVRWGLKYELELSFKLGFASREYRDCWQKHFKGNAPRINDETLRLMTFDKKNVDGKVFFVLPCDGYKTRFFTADDLHGLFAEV